MLSGIFFGRFPEIPEDFWLVDYKAFFLSFSKMQRILYKLVTDILYSFFFFIEDKYLKQKTFAFFMLKRGQMTLLIILGLLLVGSASIVYVYRDQIFLSQWERERADTLSVPQEAAELHDQISGCVEELAGDAVTLLGQQGGYIDLPADPIGEGAHNPFSNSLEIFPASDFQTAYWFYEAANGVEHSQVPSLEAMEAGLALYMDENLAACANDFELFSGYNATAGLVSTEVEILESEVLFIVYYPVHIAVDDFLFDFDAFYVSQDVPLGSLYTAATEIMDTENEEFVLEELTYDILVLHEDTPLQWTDFDCEQETWNVEEVQEALQEYVSENVGAIKVQDTSYVRVGEDDAGYFEWDLLDAGSDTLHVTFRNSVNWPFSMKVSPSENGELLEDTLTGSSSSSFLQSLFCLNHYNFIYDIRYPVQIVLFDDASDYTFQFATMVVLDNNQPRNNVEGTLELNAVQDTICANAVTPLIVDAVEVDEDGTLVFLDDAEISFQCITNKCPLGSTRYGYLETMVPQCVNGQVIAEKEGYQRGLEVITTLEEESVTVVLERYYNLSFDIEVVDSKGNVRSSHSGESLFVTLTEKETGYSTVVSSPGVAESVLLIPGVYTVEGQMVSDVDFSISIDARAYTKCVSVPQVGIGGLFGLSDDTSCTDVETDAQELEHALTGAVTSEWFLDRYDLQDASHVTFYVTSPGTPETLEQAQDLFAYVDAGFGAKEPELR